MVKTLTLVISDEGGQELVNETVDIESGTDFSVSVDVIDDGGDTGDEPVGYGTQPYGEGFYGGGEIAAAKYGEGPHGEVLQSE